MALFDPTIPPDTQIFWRYVGQRDFIVPQRYVARWDRGQDHEIIWVFGRVDQIAVHVGDLARQATIDPHQLDVTLLLPNTD
jgi:hypothetical protein